MACTIDWLVWAPVASAVAAAIASIAACANVIIQNQNIQRNRTIDFIGKKEAEFDSERMHKHRAHAANALLSNSTKNSSIDAILDFMESIARRVTKGDVAADEVWFTFYHWFSPYYVAAKKIIATEQKNDPTIWKDLVKVNDLMDKVQRKEEEKRKEENPIPQNLAANIKKFLEDEAALLDNESE